MSLLGRRVFFLIMRNHAAVFVSLNVDARHTAHGGGGLSRHTMMTGVRPVGVWTKKLASWDGDRERPGTPPRDGGVTRGRRLGVCRVHMYRFTTLRAP